MIFEDKFEIGTIYSEAKLSQEIGISRTPIRDALQHLTAEGYVDILPSKGFMLHQLTEDDIRETCQFRCAIEGYAANVLTQECKTERGQQALESLRVLLDKQRQLAENNGDIHEAVCTDQMFHRTLVQYLQNQEFDNLFDNHIFRIKAVASRSMRIPGRIQSAFEEHQSIFDAIAGGNDQIIYQVVHRHLLICCDLSLSNCKAAAESL